MNLKTIKTRLKVFIETGLLYNTRGTTQIASDGCLSRTPTSPMLLRSNHGKRLLAVIRFWASGSEGIGNGNKFCRFAPSTDSLQDPVSAVFVTACYSVDFYSIARRTAYVKRFSVFSAKKRRVIPALCPWGSLLPHTDVKMCSRQKENARGDCICMPNML